jgi:sulfatase maturation enzyme AslB (radical SAM superfamily)
MNKRLKPSDGNKTFCMAPWTHTYLSPQTERRMCCASREPAQSFKQYIDTGNDAKEYKPLTLKEHWNSDHMKSVRLRMMAGEELPECQVCDHKLLNTDVYRSYWNNLFKDRIDEAFDSTDDTGVTTMQTISFDYRFNNLCNFKCRMCGDMLSSSWEAESRKHKTWNSEEQPWMASPLREQIIKFQDTQVVQEFVDAVESKRIKEIYWCGGEPLMWDMHWKAMQRIIELGFANEVYVRYNTNLSRTSLKGVKLFDLLPQFQDWQICSSLDGTGEVGEYIRDGLNYEQWLRNFKEGLAVAKTSREMRLDYTLTMPGMLEIKNMFDLSRELDTELLTKVMFTFSNDEILSPLSLPKQLLHTLIDEALEYIEPLATRKQRALIDVLKNLRNRDTFTPTKAGKERQENIDKIRGQDIKKILSKDERVLEWWTSI